MTTNPLNYLKTYRKRLGVSLQDMAAIIGMDVGNLSKVESGQLSLALRVVLAYQLMLNTSIERLCKDHYQELTDDCLQNAQRLKDDLLDGLEAPTIGKRIITLDRLIDRLQEHKNSYEN